MKVLLGKKIGMSQTFDKKTGELTAVTVIDIAGNVVSKIFKEEENVTSIEIGLGKQKNPSSADIGNYKSLTFVPKFKKVFKFRNKSELPEIATELKADVFQVGDIVDVSGTTKGKGFQGVIKRWGFKGGKRTHGQSDRERAPGSIGSGTTPGRVLKGKKMPGHMGNVNRTIKKLKVVDVDINNEVILVSGSVPGFNGSYLIIKESKAVIK